MWYKSKSICIILFNHNKDTSGGGEGAEVIYALRNKDTLSNLVLQELAKEGQKIRKAYQRRLPSDTSKDYYFMQRNTGITEPITVEYGFLDTTADAEKLKKNYQKYAEAVVRAVLNYIGYTEGTENTYTVKKGDSLYSVAKKYNISVEELKAANNLTSNLLSIGQILVIPEIEKQPEDYSIYTVQKGDTLYGIANKYNTTVDDIIIYNNLSSTNLTVGQKLLIPNVYTESDQYDTYIVQKGDSLYKIANEFNTTVTELMKINNLSSNLLTIGQKLLIPKKQISNEFEYVVKVGDSLYSIANKYNTTVDEIKKINNLTSNLLTIGQILKLPKIENNTYIVKSGDNLYSIANKYNTTVDEIKKKNNLTSNLLTIGQVLII